MSLLRKKKQVKPDAEQFCFQANKDEMLFFPDEKSMYAYLSDYRKKIPIYNLSMFKVQFFKLSK